MQGVDTQNLLLRYLALWNRMGVKHNPFYSFSHLYTKYSEPHRRYHDLRHVARCLAELDDIPSRYFQKLNANLPWLTARRSPKSVDVIEMALWWHDITYNPGAKDNEEQSAENMRCFLHLAGVSAEFIHYAAEGVLATKHQTIPSDPLYHWILDLDLLSFGQPYKVFMQDSENIREEYRNLVSSDDDFAVRRKQILKKFYERNPLYLTEYFREKWGDRAKENLERAMGEAVTS